MANQVWTKDHAAQRRAFTLIELLVVIAILATLMGLLMPLLGVANRTARASATRSVMAKVDTAVRLFRADIGSYPWQQSYDGLSADPVEIGLPCSNRLHWHLGSTLSREQLASLRADADTAAARYASNTGFAFTVNNTQGVHQVSTAQMLNSMAAERARLAILAGNTAIKGPYPTGYGLSVTPQRPNHADPLVASPQSADPAKSPHPGWANDYIDGELDRRHVAGHAILDAWRRPLLYLAQVVEAVHSAPIYMDDSNIDGGTSLQAYTWGMHPLGRRTLGPVDALTGTALAADAGLPDPAALRHSDRRTWAAPGLEKEFELWSAGPDGLADWMRDHPANQDNVAPIPYDRRIP